MLKGKQLLSAFRLSLLIGIGAVSCGDGSNPAAPGPMPDANRPPRAVAGPDRTVERGTIVELDGGASVDPDGDPLTYSWVMLSSPGPLLSIEAPDRPVASFLAELSGEYIVHLTVRDLSGAADADEVRIAVDFDNASPDVDPGPNRTVPVGSEVVLDGSGSTDRDGDPLEFRWLFVASPVTPPPPLLDADRPVARFTPTAPGVYMLALAVSDGKGTSVQFVTITATPPGP